MMQPIPIVAATGTSCLGTGRAALAGALASGRSGLALAGELNGVPVPGWAGRVAGLDTVALPEALQAFDCRNNRLAWLALQQDGFLQAVERLQAEYGAARIAIFLGTSTSVIAATESAYRATAEDNFAALPDWYSYRHTHNVHATTDFVARALGIAGPAQTISTACSSSAKVFAAASRALNAGICDAAIVGGVDTLCLTTLKGFDALQLVSPGPCRPADLHRQGISIGEAAGFAVLDPRAKQARHALQGYGESSDAHHMSTPDPQGRGAQLAMQAALTRANLNATDIDYINLHGTGTAANDLAEDCAVFQCFGDQLPCSSSKGWTGHCLGAAGIMEVLVLMSCLEQGLLPQSLGTETLDPALRSRVLMAPESRALRYAMSNSFGFGGTNCSLLLGALQ